MSRQGGGYCGTRPFGVPGLLLRAAPLVFRAPSGPAAGPGCLVCPWAAARPLAVRAASCARCVVSKPGQAPPPPTGTAAWPSGPSGALHTSGAWLLMCCLVPAISHAIPLGLFQTMNSHRWDFNVF